MSRRPLLFARALILHCPNCGGRGVLRHWLAMKPSCPDCGLDLATGNRPGAYILNIAMAEVVLVVVIAIVVLRTWPNPPYSLLQWLGPLLMILAPLVFYPFSKLVFVAIDLAMHPEAAPDELVHGRILGETRDERRET